jgi:hypothetical protein
MSVEPCRLHHLLRRNLAIIGGWSSPAGRSRTVLEARAGREILEYRRQREEFGPAELHTHSQEGAPGT